VKSKPLPAIDDPQRLLRLRRGAQDIDLRLVLAQPSLLAAIKLCITAAGFECEKVVYGELDIDAGHWSRIMRGEAHFPTAQLAKLMELCGNDAPLLWLLNARGYDAARLHRSEDAKDRELRETKERLARLEAEREAEHKLLAKLMGRAA